MPENEAQFENGPLDICNDALADVVHQGARAEELTLERQ
jgi:hypothetical protein